MLEINDVVWYCWMCQRNNTTHILRAGNIPEAMKCATLFRQDQHPREATTDDIIPGSECLLHNQDRSISRHRAICSCPWFKPRTFHGKRLISWIDSKNGAVAEYVGELPDLEGAIMASSDWEGAIMASSDLEGAIMASSDLEGAIMASGDLEGAIMASSDLEGAIMASSDLEGAIMASSDLGAIMASSDLEGAIMASSDQEGATMASSDLEGAIMASIDLEGAIMACSDLEGADSGLQYMRTKPQLMERLKQQMIRQTLYTEDQLQDIRRFWWSSSAARTTELGFDQT